MALPVVRHRGEFAAARGFVAVVRAARTCVESNFGRPTPSTQPNSLVDFHTGEIRFLSQDAAFWMESRDADKNFCFEHGETGERVYYDPRFAKDTDVPNVRRWKLECLNALRPAVYLGAGLVEAWDTAAEGARGKKARQETLKRVLKNAKTFVRDLSSEVLRAKELWAVVRRVVTLGGLTPSRLRPLVT